MVRGKVLGNGHLRIRKERSRNGTDGVFCDAYISHWCLHHRPNEECCCSWWMTPALLGFDAAVKWTEAVKHNKSRISRSSYRFVTLREYAGIQIFSRRSNTNLKLPSSVMWSTLNDMVITTVYPLSRIVDVPFTLVLTESSLNDEHFSCILTSRARHEGACDLLIYTCFEMGISKFH